MNESIDNVISASNEDISPRELLKFAKLILLILALIFIFGIVIEVFFPNKGIFDSCKTILPPISTLVIGYYFGKS